MKGGIYSLGHCKLWRALAWRAIIAELMARVGSLTRVLLGGRLYYSTSFISTLAILACYSIVLV